MKNAEVMIRDVGFVIGQYEREEITAVEAITKINDLIRDRCEHCAYNGKCTPYNSEYGCYNGYREFLEQE